MPSAEALPDFDLYATLGVSPWATVEEIESAYRHAAKRVHPDTTTDPEGATARMQRLNLARRWLTDPVRRGEYDRLRLPHPSSDIHVPDIDPLVAWPGQTTDRADPGSGARSMWHVIVLVAMMVNLATIVVGIGSSYVSVVAFALSATILVFAVLIAVVGWLTAMRWRG